MKFLAALIHAAAAASSQAGAGPLAVVLDSLAPVDNTTIAISKDQSVAVQFRSPPVADGCDTASGSGDIDCTLGLKLEFVNFTVRTIDISTDASLWLQAELCSPDVEEGLPGCTKSCVPHIPIQEFAEQVTFQWSPPSPIELKPNTKYWFTVRSNGETKDKSPLWLLGGKNFADTREDDVKLAYTKSDDVWYAASTMFGRIMPWLQVYTS
ncbi:hypothetical protein DYB37_007161 [Aphanomyces astaci]|nr:hypothetical protein DYB36_002478 [Aphanomyces astaci]RHZ06334.1 hypothetical protein DYB37_007161 [Aphanomyces astaci]RHZ16719.1 hypothetical protein DYB31_004083 [Aphanomyces astaci]RHZ38055.1 hypothetical protein DYB26_005775 [Aphanomyces astaci]RLO12643.1 hypothetical protein DYB28_001518 [Aphanomyces astaci]